MEDLPLPNLRHSEGTTRTSGTYPTIGFGDAKECRDLSATGVSVGAHLGSPGRDPIRIDMDSHHILAYDIEKEYSGKRWYNTNSPILCVSLVCSCGWMHIIT
jgi:hypothetical protein